MTRLEQFTSVATFTDQTLANHICANLEDSGIAVMLEHVHVQEGAGNTPGFRLFVPSELVQTAGWLIESVSAHYYGNRLSRPGLLLAPSLN